MGREKRRRKRKKRKAIKMCRRVFSLLTIGILIITFKGIFKGPSSSKIVLKENINIKKQDVSRKQEVSRNYNKNIEKNFVKENMGDISIDPGHGGIDGGAMDDQGLLEKDINLDISMELKRQLESEGFNITMTREEDVSLEDFSYVKRSRYIRDIYARTDIIRESNPDSFVSLHVNASEDSSIRGIRIYYYPTSEEAKELAECICSSMNSNEFLKTSTVESTSLPENYHLLREVEFPGVLVEVGFITNSEDNKLLRDDRYRNEVALSIKRGIEIYLKK